MKYSFAPLEGITTYIFRNTHARLFGGCAEYYAPFIAPDGSGTFKVSKLTDIMPENNRDITLIPQVLANSAFAFVKVSEQLAELGYRTVNLNAGCPSGTVFAKHKGAGMLADLSSLDAFLDEVFSSCKINVSVKTRLGVASTDEFAAILEIYNKYPISQLIIHARDRAGQYRSIPDTAAFKTAFLNSCCGCISYNGNIFSAKDANAISAEVPGLDSIMAGRGAVANPALFRQLAGGAALDSYELHEYHRIIVDAFRQAGLNEHFTLARSKELWQYMICMFDADKRTVKQLFKASSLSDFMSAADILFNSGGFEPENFYHN